MKNIKYILVLLVFSLFATACTDYLNIKPDSQMLLDDYWKKGSDVEAVVLACYRGMQESDFMKRTILWGELRSDNVVPSSNAGDEIKQINNVNILPTNSYCSWASFYSVINYCNTVLKYAPEVVNRDPNFTTADLHAKQAEVLAIRALCYFYLVRTFRDVPLVLDATISDDQKLEVKQSAPEIVLDKITTDLLQAEEWALTVYPTEEATKGRMTKDAIRAILADVYLWRGSWFANDSHNINSAFDSKKEYQNCISYCDKLINATTLRTNSYSVTAESPKYEIVDEMPSYYIFGKGNSSESILELQYSTEVANGDIENLYGSSLITDVGQLTAVNVYANPESPVFSKTDDRKSDFIVISDITKIPESGVYPIFKYRGGMRLGIGSVNSYSFKQTTSNWIFYRITDIMLMKAEALVQLNSSESALRQAIHLVNITNARAKSTQKTDTLSYDNYNSPDAMEKLVLLERQRELMFEGKRWFDLVRMAERKNSTNVLVDCVRNKYTSDLSTIVTKLSVMNAIYMPISASELKVNSLLNQNPYYQTSSNIVK